MYREVFDIKELIPQRDPFLFVTSFERNSDDSLTTSFTFKESQEFFQGHFPGNPIVPGVILSEHCFQSAAALIALTSEGSKDNSLAVLSRIQSAKFKSIVRPGETITTSTVCTEKLGPAAYFKSIVQNQQNKKVLIIEFSCTLIEEEA